MMDDLISRQAAIELIESEYSRWGEEYGITDVLCDLDDLPTAEKKGKWKISDLPKGQMKYCSECGFGQYIADMRTYHYCPNCGARMEN